MLTYLVKVKIVGSGNCFCLRNTRTPSIKWSCYAEGGYRFRTGDDCYTFRKPRVPHFMFWYYENYHVEYSVTHFGISFSWKHFLNLSHLNIEDGDIVIDESNKVRYLMVRNPVTSRIDHYKIY